MAITTKEQLKEYILRQLGFPLVRVELHDDNLEDVIAATIQEFTTFAYAGELEDTIILEVDGKGDYQLPDPVTSIIKVSQGSLGALANFGGNYGKGYVPDMWSQQFFTLNPNGVTGIINSIIGISATQSILEKYMGDDLAYNFNPYKKVLRLFEPYSGPVVIHYSYEYIAEDIDYIFDQNWVKRMCVAQSRLLQSTVTGKYDAALVGGSRINYENMRSLAEQEIEKLREDLQLQYAGPAPMFVG